jgi:hypothetical protein
MFLFFQRSGGVVGLQVKAPCANSNYEDAQAGSA